MRTLRWILGGLSVLVGLVLLAVAAAWVWSGTEGSARWVLEQVARRQPLQAEGVRGSLRQGVQAERLAWNQDGLLVEAHAVQLEWQPLALLRRQLRVDQLRAARIRIDDRRPKTGEKPQPPASLALPIQVAVGELVAGRIDWVGPPAVALEDLAAAYDYDGATHHLSLRNLVVQGGHYRGDARLGDRGEFPLQARVQGRFAAPLPGAPDPLPLVFEARAAGPLAGFDLTARIEGEPGAGATSATRANASARVTPWAALPLASARADFESLDVGALWPQAPHTLLGGRVSLQSQGPSAWAVSADVRNALAGPWDRRRLPVARLRAEADWRQPRAVLVRELEAEVGGGRVQARGRWEGEDAWALDGTLARIDPAAVHSAMAPVPLSGRVGLRGAGPAVAFDTELSAGAAAAAPAAGSELAAAVGALELRTLTARGRWSGQELSLPLLVVRTADARLDAAFDLKPSTRTGRGRADLEAPGLRLRAVGSLAPAAGGGTARLAAGDLAQAQRWLAKLPAMPAIVAGTPVAGRGELQLGWQGGWDDPTVQATLALPLLEASGAQASAWSVHDVTARLDGRLADARLDLRGRGRWAGRDGALEIAGRGGRRGADAWQGEVASLAASVRDPQIAPGPWRVTLRSPVAWRWAGGQLALGAGQATLAAPVARPAEPALFAWDPLHWRSGQLRTAGRLTGLPLAWIELVAGPQRTGAALAGDLVFDAQWDAQLGDSLRLRASLARSRGDISVLAETAEGAPARVQAGVREARLALESEGDGVTLSLRWDSERAGTAEARVASRLARTDGTWTWPETAPLDGMLRAQLPRLGVWSLLAPPGWRLRGSLAADLAVAGTRGDPALSGTLRADDLALRSVVDGVALQDGRLRARLAGHRLVVEELSLRGAGPEGGRLAGSGEGEWTREGVQVRVAATLDRLRASARSDRELTVSGQVSARMDGRAAEVRGDLRVDRARIRLPDEAAPRLGDDVVVRNLPPGVAIGDDRRTSDPQGGPSARPLTLAVNLNLGDDFRVQGRGIQTRLAGTLVVSGDSLAAPRLVGVINTVGGEYQAYGQRLDIERGVLRFTGPVDNPALDVLAIRPRLTQRVGVQVTGTAQAPFVRLYAEPDLPEAEKLSWLVLGRPAAQGGAETALLQQAAVALLASRSGRSGSGKGVAGLVGLDELSFSRSGAEGPAVTLGKRLGRNLYAAYERSLSGAVGTLFVFYDLSRRVTVRAQAGERAALDLIFTFAYD
ncbi:MAG TPA: translocation/assembly module TamB domain-containing protein [Ramlibacter sp.]|jgi:translocation and assembly module TamB|uniref:translocation/assembly module TamB domain-containing protein n=1 Tax=Ramlibacter sp. TaxID=1917967 RepID=UPI002D22EE4A|nr:translocation/assembly module TamB domain-containing protein [Ramlibacter sp.]HZY19089.1 translocation/assembly module TamB domain-containing protein [Ramlibacter sp.]